jgi:hypothetical protein
MARKPLIPPKNTKFSRGDHVLLRGEVMKSRIDDMAAEYVEKARE